MLRPLWRFAKSYLLQRYFLCGIPGFIYAGLLGAYVFLTEAKLYRLQAGSAEGEQVGILVILFALFLNAAKLPKRSSVQLYWMLVATGYGNTLFYWAGLFAPNRALTLGDNAFGESNLFAILGFLPAFTVALVLIVAMVIVIRWAFSRDRLKY